MPPPRRMELVEAPLTFLGRGSANPHRVMFMFMFMFVFMFMFMFIFLFLFLFLFLSLFHFADPRSAQI